MAELTFITSAEKKKNNIESASGYGGKLAKVTIESDKMVFEALLIRIVFVQVQSHG